MIHVIQHDVSGHLLGPTTNNANNIKENDCKILPKQNKTRRRWFNREFHCLLLEETSNKTYPLPVKSLELLWFLNVLIRSFLLSPRMHLFNQ